MKMCEQSLSTVSTCLGPAATAAAMQRHNQPNAQESRKNKNKNKNKKTLTK
jgi:hypothetical protein